MSKQQTVSAHKNQSVKRGARIGRRGFALGILYIWTFFLIPIVLQLLVRFFIMSPNEMTSDSLTRVVNLISLLIGIVGVTLVLPVSIYLYIRRFHDLDLSGVLAFLALVPLVNLLVLLYLAFTPGTTGRNSYGMPIKSNNFWAVIGFSDR